MFCDRCASSQRGKLCYPVNEIVSTRGRGWLAPVVDRAIPIVEHLAGCGKTRFTGKAPVTYRSMALTQQCRWMLKRAVQQGRSERRGEAYASVR